MVLAVRKEIDKVYEQAGKTSPFSNRLRTKWLGLLEENAAAKLGARERSFESARLAERRKANCGC